LKPSSKIISTNLRSFLQRSGLPRNSSGEEQPLRAELFSEEQMEQHGKTLATWHKVSPLQGPDQLLSRLAENEAVIGRCCYLLTETVKANRRITPAGEWLLDNFYLIEEQIRTARKHLPRGYSRELPRLLNGPSAGFPRVYDLALETISHGDGRIALSGFSRFVAAYQKVTPLKLGELWAIPIMLRLALIENLRRVGVRIATDTIDRDKAESWADQMMEIAEKDPKSLILVIADMARSNPPMVSSFVAELARRLQGQGPALALPLTWIEQRLAESGLTIDQLVQSETQQQAADQVSISNSIGSLGSLGAVDWRDFVEANSIIERILLEDPDGVYSKMDFATRDHYRRVVEKLAKKTDLSEGDVARKAIELAQGAAAIKVGDTRAVHVGFYLVYKGLPQLQKAAQVRDSFVDAVRRLSSKSPLLFYLGSIIFIAIILTDILAGKAVTNRLPEWLFLLTMAVSLLSTSELAVALVNWLCAFLVAPQPLPRMDFSKGIPATSRALVVVPTMLASPRNIESLVEALEVRFLANRDENLYFALVTDLQDAQTETTPGDEALVQLARQSIDELNEKYKGKKDTFFLFHRPRRFNSQEHVWMG
jgi:cyclic beta-1,2-glucan synthetase